LGFWQAQYPEISILNSSGLSGEGHYKDIEVIPKLDGCMVQQNYLQIKQDVQDIIQSEMERLNDPGLKHLVVKNI